MGPLGVTGLANLGNIWGVLMELRKILKGPISKSENIFVRFKVLYIICVYTCPPVGIVER